MDGVNPRRPRRGPAMSSGFSLVELIVAACIAGTVLTASWAWLWQTGAAASRADHRAQAATAAASALRAVATDLRCSTGVLEPPPGRDADHCLHLRHDHTGSPAERVLICWDEARSVLWRNAPGTYLSSGVVDFTVEYLTDPGALVSGHDVPVDAWPTVRLAHVEVTVDVCGSRAVRSISVALGGT